MLASEFRSPPPYPSASLGGGDQSRAAETPPSPLVGEGWGGGDAPSPSRNDGTLVPCAA